MSTREVVMLGVSLDAPGGMAAVVNTLREGGLFREFRVRYLVTYESRSPARQFRLVSQTLIKLLWLIARRKVALVHAHSASRGSFWRKSLFCAVAHTLGVPYVFHLHSGEFPTFFAEECGPHFQRWIRRTLRLATTVVCLTNTWREYVLDIEPLARVSVIGNPVAVASHLIPLRNPPRNVLFLGRLRKKKGVLDLVSAIPRVLAVCPQLHFVLAGDEGTEQIRSHAAALGVSHALELPGWIAGKRKDAYLAQADISVLPSHFEALGVSNLEAMAMGIPVLSTNVGGIPDIIENGVQGILVAPSDVEAIASALIALASDCALRERLRDAAYEKVKKHYSISAVVASFAALYRSLGVGEASHTSI